MTVAELGQRIMRWGIKAAIAIAVAFLLKWLGATDPAAVVGGIAFGVGREWGQAGMTLGQGRHSLAGQLQVGRLILSDWKRWSDIAVPLTVLLLTFLTF